MIGVVDCPSKVSELAKHNKSRISHHHDRVHAPSDVSWQIPCQILLIDWAKRERRRPLILIRKEAEFSFQSYLQARFKFVTVLNPLPFIIKVIPILCNLFVHYFRSMLKLLDVLVQLDHLKNAKASIPNDFSWYKRYDCSLSLYIHMRVCVSNFYSLSYLNIKLDPPLFFKLFWLVK